MRTEKEFLVCVFYAGGGHSYVARRINVKAAMEVVQDFICRPAAMTGLIKRIIITDGDNDCMLEWLAGPGVVFSKIQDEAEVVK